jgi:hypothetical protein
MPAPEVAALLARGREKLFAARALRPRPLLDDKILTAWNGLMISAFARAGQALDEPRYSAAAEAAAEFIRTKLFDPATGRLHRRYRAGEVAIAGFLDDYAFLIQGLLDLYEATFRVEWLSWAVELQEKQDACFWDTKGGGYFSTSGQDASILVQMREEYDGAEPSPNSVSALNLLRLALLTDRDPWREKAEKLFAVSARRLEESPEAVPQLVAALEFRLSKPKHIIIAGERQAQDTRTLLRVVQERFIPHKALLLVDSDGTREQLAQWLPFIRNMTPSQGKATAYICEDYQCSLPTWDPVEAARLLAGRN